MFLVMCVNLFGFDNHEVIVSKVIKPSGKLFLMFANPISDEEQELKNLQRNPLCTKEEVKSSLVRAVENGYEAVVESLLLTPNLNCDKDWAFFQAIRNNRAQIVKSFLHFKCDSIGTALCIAVKRGHYNIVRILLDSKQISKKDDIIQAYNATFGSDFFYWNRNNPANGLKIRDLLKPYLLNQNYAELLIPVQVTLAKFL